MKGLFELRPSGLGLTSYLKLEDRNHTQSEKIAWPILHSELKGCVLPLHEQTHIMYSVKGFYNNGLREIELR